MYNKLFAKILDSSIWMESNPTRIVWFTFLAAMDEDGIARFASIKNLAHRAIVSVEDAEKAVHTLESPDSDSADPDHEGRRIERIDGGWIVLNAEKYRDLVKREMQRQQTRERVARHRASKKKGKCNATVTVRNENVTQSYTYTYTDTNTYIRDEKFKELWISFLDMRKSIKAKPTQKAVDLLMAKLHKQPLKIACQMLEESIESNWKGVYPPKGGRNGKRSQFERNQQAIKEFADEHGCGDVLEGNGNSERALPEARTD